jgi:DNA-binding LacI/PurR family transcriptional regulator
VAVEAGPDESVPVVTVDQVAGAAAATRHLLELGHRTVWHVAGPADWLEARQRVDGWMAALEAAGAAPPPLVAGDWSASSGYEIGKRLASVRDVTAVFAANDQMALGILRAMHEAGRDVPRDLSVVGFDDIPEAQFFTPPLTTVHQDFQRGRAPEPHAAARRDRRARALRLARGGATQPEDPREHRPAEEGLTP